MVRVTARIVALDVHDSHYTTEDAAMMISDINEMLILNNLEPLFDHIIIRSGYHGVLFFTARDFNTFHAAISRLMPHIPYSMIDEHGPAGFSAD